MKNTILEYYQTILEKVSFNAALFKKEYLKAIKSLASQDVELLKLWILQKGFYTEILEN